MATMNLETRLAQGGMLLTEGAVGQRIEREFMLAPDPHLVYAPLIYDERGKTALEIIYRSYLRIAARYQLPMLLMTNTRRANRERMAASQYGDRPVMRDYAEFLRGIADDYACDTYIGGMIGCKHDAYSGSEGLSTADAIAFHRWQLDQFAGAPIDYLFAGIMPTLPEAVGMAQVMAEIGLPYIISLMINERGTLLDGASIDSAISEIDSKSQRPPLSYVTNCVHPGLLRDALAQPCNRTANVRARFRGIQANAARLDLAAIDGARTLQTTTPEALCAAFQALHADFPMQIYGGCCGTDDRHIEALARLFAQP